MPRAPSPTPRVHICFELRAGGGQAIPGGRARPHFAVASQDRLHRAAEKGHADAVAWLLEAKAAPWAQAAMQAELVVLGGGKKTVAKMQYGRPTGEVYEEDDTEVRGLEIVCGDAPFLVGVPAMAVREGKWMYDAVSPSPGGPPKLAQ